MSNIVPEQVAGSTFNLGRGVGPFGDVRSPNHKSFVYDVTKIGQDRYKSEESIEVFLSRDEYQARVNASVKAEGAYGLFSGSFEATFGAKISSLEEHSATLVSLRHAKRCDIVSKQLTAEFITEAEKLPNNLNLDNYKSFFDFFEKFGTFVITEVHVGGTLDYATLMDRSVTEEERSIEGKVKAEYGAVFKTAASAAQAQEIQRVREHRKVKLRVRGGKTSSMMIDIENASLNAPYKGKCESWLESVEKTPDVVSFTVASIVTAFSEDKIAAAFSEKKRAAVEQAIEMYLPGTVSVESSWERSKMVVWGDLQTGEPAANAALAPRLRIRAVDRKTLQYIEKWLEPGASAGKAEMRKFWQDAVSEIEAIEPKSTLLLVATECWPKTSLYFPSPEMEQLLLFYGAHSNTLGRWRGVTEGAFTLDKAGVSYALIGDPSPEGGVDGFAVGFGEPTTDLRPTVRLTALVHRHKDSQVQVLARDAIEATNTTLWTIEQCHRTPGGERRMLAAGAGSAVVVKKEAPSDGRQFWWILELRRYNLDSFLLINYKTSGCLQGNGPKRDRQDKQAELIELNYPIQDDVLWVQYNHDVWHRFLLLHWHNDQFSLSVEKDGAYDNLNVAVYTYPWDKEGRMCWRRSAGNPKFTNRAAVVAEP